MSTQQDGSAVPALLVVDDEESIRLLVRRILEGAGYRVYEATDGVNALTALEQLGPVDAVISDVRMPHMGGWELAACLATKWPKMPILFISGYDAAPVAFSGPLLPKPFRSDQLTAGVQRLLEKRQQSA
jgi:CheY-like chemotaxis protein